MDDRVELSPVPGGVRLRLRVKPGGRRSRLVGAHGGALKLEVVAAPEKGKANQAVARLLAEALGTARSAVEITTGAAAQDKTVVVAGVTVEEVARRLSRAGVQAG